MSGIVVIAEHLEGELADITLEMLACGRRLADEARTNLTCLVLTNQADSFKGLPLAADRMIIIRDGPLAEFNPEAYLTVLNPLLGAQAPRLVLVGNTGPGMDLAGPLSLALEAQVVGNCTALEISGDHLVATSQLYGGKIIATSEFTAETGIALLMAGNYPREEGLRDRVPEVEIREALVPFGLLRIEFEGFIEPEPEPEEVDITKVPVLVAAGRGIGGAANIELLEELAGLLGGAVCASRPVVDQGWLPRSRQVGRSGMSVKPRLYLALGISGAPEHVEGMKEAELIVAVNTDESAPIFDVAHYGTTADLFDIVESLTERIKALRGG